MTEKIFSKIKRRYFEAFGDLEEEIKFLRKLSLIFLSFIFLLLIFLFIFAKKPPVVIRVSEVEGARPIESLKENNAPSEHEMIGFAKRFIRRYTGYNSYTISRDMAEAMNQMTYRFQKQAQKKLIDSGFLEKIAQAEIDTELEFKEARLERDSNEAAVLSLVGVRRVSKYGAGDFNQEVLFRADLVLKKVERRETIPEGLLVEEYREILLNELTERKRP